MLLLTGCFLCASFSVVSANNASPTKKSTLIVEDEITADLSAIVKKAGLDLKNNVAILSDFYIDFEQSKYMPEYKMGALKNKVNIIHLFYKVKI